MFRGEAMISSGNFKTQYCKRPLKNGKCKYGDGCFYAHNPLELRPTTFVQMQFPLFKTKLCDTFGQYNKCKFGDKCQYAHGIQELRTIKDNINSPVLCTEDVLTTYQREAPFNRTRSAYYKTRICNPFEDGYCKDGDECQYAHGRNELRNDIRRKIPEKYRTVICKFYLRGNCKNGNECNYRHAEK